MVQVIAANNTHEADMVKRFSMYLSDQKEAMDVIHAALQERSDELAQISDKMTPPFPFIPFDMMQKGYHIPITAMVIGAALAQTSRSLAAISEREWISYFDEYTTIASGKGSSHKVDSPADDVRFTDEMVQVSKKIGEHIVPYAKSYSAKHGQSPMSYLQMSGKISPRIVAALAIIHTSRYLVALKTKQN